MFYVHLTYLWMTCRLSYNIPLSSHIYKWISQSLYPSYNLYYKKYVVFRQNEMFKKGKSDMGHDIDNQTADNNVISM